MLQAKYNIKILHYDTAVVELGYKNVFVIYRSSLQLREFVPYEP